MITSIATVSIAGELPEKLAAIAEAGFDGIEIFEQDFIAHDAGPRAVGRMVRDHGLDILLFQPFRDFEGLPEPDRTRAFDRAERKFDVMEELGVDLVLVCSSVHPRALGGIDRAADDLAELGERAARRGLRIGYEALAWGHYVNDHRDAWEIVRRANHPAVGLILDSFHTLARQIDPDTIRAIPGDRIFFVQLADAPAIDMDLLFWSRHFRVMPGEGDLDVPAFMRAVAASGYAGPVSLEIFNDQFRGGSPRRIARDGMRALLALMDDVRRAEPGIRIDVPPMPPRVQAEGVEFIEFAADEVEAERLGAMLATMGFARVGQHINKHVARWRQGGINIVINTEREGFAHASYLARGTSVCDMGIRVADAAATVERARALGVKVFRQPTGEGELDLPAIESVGSGLMHFLDEASGLTRVWDVEFRPLPGESRDAGLTRIDHIAQTMTYEEMLTWVLFYTALFDVVKRPMVDVIDPGGVVRSQAIESRDGRFRITLNGAESARTLAGRFVAERTGSAVQHVAFATDDIFATAERLAALGFEALPMPGNYHDDIAARFGIDEARLERLRAFNILYDADDRGGEYFQLYSRPYGGGFFFEIVCRRGGYGGYGAANAPYRIAALRRLLREVSAGAGTE